HRRDGPDRGRAQPVAPEPESDALADPCPRLTNSIGPGNATPFRAFAMITRQYLAGLCILIGCQAIAHGDDWPQFRGPTGQGHADVTGAPTRWSEEENIRWKVQIAGLGWSSPVVAGGRIWLTTAVDIDQSLHVLCLDSQSGKVLHDVAVFR